MDLLSTLSGASGGLTGRLGNSSGVVCDDTCGTGTSDGDFMATLAGLLDAASAPADEATLSQLAEVAGDAGGQEAAVWPLGLLLGGAASRSAMQGSEAGADGHGEGPVPAAGGRRHADALGEPEGDQGTGSADTVGEVASGGAGTGSMTDEVVAPEHDVAAPSLPDGFDPEEAGEAIDQGDREAAVATDGRATAGGAAATMADAAMTDDQARGPRGDTRTGMTTATATVDGSSRGDEAPLRIPSRSAATAVGTDEIAQDAQRNVRADPSSSGTSTADAVRTEHAPPPGSGATSSMDPASRAASMADGVRRVLEAIELLENAPPPRHLTIDVGEARLRVALEDNAVRVTVLDGASSDELDELLRAAEDALAEQGFDLGRERDGNPEGQQPEDRLTAPPSRSTRADARGLRL